MSDLYIYLLFALLIFAAKFIYFRIADRYNIIDRPNHRSSHSEITIRGGGVIFPVAVLLFAVFSGFEYHYFTIGLFLISFISFWDDLFTASNKIRIAIHLLAVSFMFYELSIYHFPVWMIIAAYIVIIGIINAYNFMDGINGITGFYSLVLLATLLWINQYLVAFVNTQLLIALLIAVMIFNFSNFRKKALCFAGDVGSVSMAFIISFLLMKLILQTNQLLYLFLLAIYGIDVVFTIMVRLSRRENIFKAHRLHLYQLLVNEKRIAHLKVSAIYGLVQLLFNVLIIYFINANSPFWVIGVFAALMAFYLLIRLKVSPKAS